MSWMDYVGMTPEQEMAARAFGGANPGSAYWPEYVYENPGVSYTDEEWRAIQATPYGETFQNAVGETITSSPDQQAGWAGARDVELVGGGGYNPDARMARARAIDRDASDRGRYAVHNPDPLAPDTNLEWNAPGGASWPVSDEEIMAARYQNYAALPPELRGVLDGARGRLSPEAWNRALNDLAREHYGNIDDYRAGATQRGYELSRDQAWEQMNRRRPPAAQAAPAEGGEGLSGDEWHTTFVGTSRPPYYSAQDALAASPTLARQVESAQRRQLAAQNRQEAAQQAQSSGGVNIDTSGMSPTQLADTLIQQSDRGLNWGTVNGELVAVPYAGRRDDYRQSLDTLGMGQMDQGRGVSGVDVARQRAGLRTRAREQEKAERDARVAEAKAKADVEAQAAAQERQAAAESKLEDRRAKAGEALQKQYEAAVASHNANVERVRNKIRNEAAKGVEADQEKIAAWQAEIDAMGGPPTWDEWYAGQQKRGNPYVRDIEAAERGSQAADQSSQAAPAQAAGQQQSAPPKRGDPPKTAAQLDAAYGEREWSQSWQDAGIDSYQDYYDVLPNTSNTDLIKHIETAEKWAREHPNDPEAIEILNILLAEKQARIARGEWNTGQPPAGPPPPSGATSSPAQAAGQQQPAPTMTPELRSRARQAGLDDADINAVVADPAGARAQLESALNSGNLSPEKRAQVEAALAIAQALGG